MTPRELAVLGAPARDAEAQAQARRAAETEQRSKARDARLQACAENVWADIQAAVECIAATGATFARIWPSGNIESGKIEIRVPISLPLTDDDKKGGYTEEGGRESVLYLLAKQFEAAQFHVQLSHREYDGMITGLSLITVSWGNGK